MPRKPLDAEKMVDTVGRILEHVRQAEIQLNSAAKLFEELPRSFPHAPARMTKICDTGNQLSALWVKILTDVQNAPWCDDAMNARFVAMHEEYLKLREGRFRDV